MSAFRGKAELEQHGEESPLLTHVGHGANVGLIPLTVRELAAVLRCSYRSDCTSYRGNPWWPSISTSSCASIGKSLAPLPLPITPFMTRRLVSLCERAG